MDIITELRAWFRHFIRTLTGKIVLWFIGLNAAVYILLFTPLGNRLSYPVLESLLESGFKTPIHVHEFELERKRFHLLIQDDYGNTVSTQGGFSLMTLRFYAHYRIKCFRGGGINRPGVPFETDGSVSGGIAALNIRGKARIFDGELHYKSEFHRFKLADSELILDNIAYEQLLHFLNYPSITDTRLSGSVELKGFDRRDVSGTIRMHALTGKLTPTLVTRDDNGSSFDLRTFFADDNGKIAPFELNVSTEITLEHAGILEQFIGTHLKGPLSLESELIGNEKNLRLRLTTSLADSNTTATAAFYDFKPLYTEFTIRHADLEPLFAFLNIPPPLSGILGAEGKLDGASSFFNLRIDNGKINADVLKQTYGITQPRFQHFDTRIHADLNGSTVHYTGTYRSDLSRMEFDTTAPHEQMLNNLLNTIPSKR